MTPPRAAPRTLAAAMLVVALAAGLAAAAGIGIRATAWATTTGDEPHYLLTAISLAEDADLDVTDEIADGRHRSFHQAALAPQALRRGGALVEPHDPLLPALLAPAVAAGGHVGAKLLLSLMASALAALTVWTGVRRLALPPWPVAAVVGVLSAAAPLAAYGSQVYPELPAALAVACAAAALTGPLRRGGLAVLLVAVVALPWLSVKYVPVAFALAVVGGARLVRAGRGATAAWCGALLGGAGVAYVAAHLAWYGGLTVYASGAFFADNGGQAAVVGTDPAYLGRARRLAGLLVDRDFGIAAWQPAWLAAVAAVAALARRRPSWWLVVAAPVAAGWLTATFVAATMHGWWFPGRQVVVVLPLLALAVAWWVGSGRARLAVVAGGGALGVASWGWLVTEGWRERITLVVDPIDTTNPWYRLWRLLRPDGTTAQQGVLDALWIAGLVAVAVLAWRRAGRAAAPLARPAPSPRAPSGAGAR